MRLNDAYARMGQMMIELNQQFLTDETKVVAIGADDEYELTTIIPAMLKADYDFDISPMNESLSARSDVQRSRRSTSSPFSPPVHVMMPSRGWARR
jgi:hypothetical protein